MAEATPGKGAVTGWTEESETEFLLRMIAHLKGSSGGKAINWKEVTMRGRSTKALQSQWTAVNKAIAELEVLGDAPMTPTKPTPKKAAAAKRKSDANEDDGQVKDEPVPIKKAPKKRGGPAAKKVKEEAGIATPPTSLKTEEDEDEDGTLSSEI